MITRNKNDGIEQIRICEENKEYLNSLSKMTIIKLILDGKLGVIFDSFIRVRTNARNKIKKYGDASIQSIKKLRLYTSIFDKLSSNYNNDELIEIAELINKSNEIFIKQFLEILYFELHINSFKIMDKFIGRINNKRIVHDAINKVNKILNEWN